MFHKIIFIVFLFSIFACDRAQLTGDGSQEVGLRSGITQDSSSIDSNLDHGNQNLSDTPIGRQGEEEDPNIGRQGTSSGDGEDSNIGRQGTSTGEGVGGGMAPGDDGSGGAVPQPLPSLPPFPTEPFHIPGISTAFEANPEFENLPEELKVKCWFAVSGTFLGHSGSSIFNAAVHRGSFPKMSGGGEIVHGKRFDLAGGVILGARSSEYTYQGGMIKQTIDETFDSILIPPDMTVKIKDDVGNILVERNGPFIAISGLSLIHI